MGMAASQVRLLQLTSRKNDIGYQLSRLSNDKVSLTREMQKVSRDYQNSLNQKVLKWSNNSGVSYIDLSYNNLMKPSLMNQNKPYLLTDTNGAVVVDDAYKKYAAMISPNGAPGGDWESVRTQVLSELTGIDAAKIEQASNILSNATVNSDSVNELIEKEPVKPTKKTDLATFLKNLGSTGAPNGFSDGDDWASAYVRGGTVKISGNNHEKLLQDFFDTIANTLGQYVDDPENLKEACDTYRKSMIILPGKVTCTYDVKTMMDTIMGSYSVLSNNCEPSSSGSGFTYTWSDINSQEYQDYLTEHDAWQKEYDAAMADYSSSVATGNELFTAEEASNIEYYDAIFSAIAEKGWTYNSNINDTEYLNQLLQNNMYTLTTVDRQVEYDKSEGRYGYANSYSTDIASNFTNVFTVADTDAREDALSEYEYQKSIINAKETKIDTRMENLQTEQSAINQMLQSIQQVMNKNIESTMNIFS